LGKPHLGVGSSGQGGEIGGDLFRDFDFFGHKLFPSLFLGFARWFEHFEEFVDFPVTGDVPLLKLR
jgi:hypothetical protein